MWDGKHTVRHAIVKPLGRLEFGVAERRRDSQNFGPAKPDRG